MTFRKFSAAVLSVILLTLIAMACANKAYEKDAQEIRSVIQSQLHAVSRDDAEVAFSFTSTSTRGELGSPDDFMDLIRHDFPMLYRHRQVMFEEPDIDVNHATQIVQFIDEKDSVWVGIYKMQREKNGSWKVAGCQLIETASVYI
ncbi:MAG: DUF4864 domain-containing protein [Burkholderiaceae bacterium]